jgi:hypothetical protein
MEANVRDYIILGYGGGTCCLHLQCLKPEGGERMLLLHVGVRLPNYVTRILEDRNISGSMY